jgi:hypothetical protein
MPDKSLRPGINGRPLYLVTDLEASRPMPGDMSSVFVGPCDKDAEGVRLLNALR